MAISKVLAAAMNPTIRASSAVRVDITNGSPTPISSLSVREIQG